MEASIDSLSKPSSSLSLALQGHGLPSAPTCKSLELTQSEWPPVDPRYLGQYGFWTHKAFSDPLTGASLPLTLSPPCETDHESRSLYQLNQRLAHTEHFEKVAKDLSGLVKQVAWELKEFKKKMQMSSAQLNAKLKQFQDHASQAKQLDEERIEAIEKILEPFLRQYSDFCWIEDGNGFGKERAPEPQLRKCPDNLWDRRQANSSPQKENATSFEEAFEPRQEHLDSTKDSTKSRSGSNPSISRLTQAKKAFLETFTSKESFARSDANGQVPKRATGSVLNCIQNLKETEEKAEAAAKGSGFCAIEIAPAPAPETKARRLSQSKPQETISVKVRRLLGTISEGEFEEVFDNVELAVDDKVGHLVKKVAEELGWKEQVKLYSQGWGHDPNQIAVGSEFCCDCWPPCRYKCMSTSFANWSVHDGDTLTVTLSKWKRPTPGTYTFGGDYLGYRVRPFKDDHFTSSEKLEITAGLAFTWKKVHETNGEEDGVLEGPVSGKIDLSSTWSFGDKYTCLLIDEGRVMYDDKEVYPTPQKANAGTKQTTGGRKK